MSILDSLTKIDIFKEWKKNENFIWRPFNLDYSKASILVSDAWKSRANWIPQGAFLLAFYDWMENVSEAILLRAIWPTKLPTDNSIVSSMIEYYKNDIDEEWNWKNKLDDFTRYEYSFSWLECRILWSFYMNETSKKIEFWADIENFYSANNYQVYKATWNVLEYIVNQRDWDEIAWNPSEFKIWTVRYSSSRRFQTATTIDNVKTYINPRDFLWKRTSLFGMTRTGKSNTIKKIIEATVEISKKAKIKDLPKIINDTTPENHLEVFDKTWSPKYPVGQLIFDINWEYANANMQDEWTAIFELYKDDVIRYSVIEKTWFKVLKINFYNEIQSGFWMIKSSLSSETWDYIKSFLAIDLNEPENYKSKPQDRTSDENEAAILYDRKKVLYYCCLRKADFPIPSNISKVKFYWDVATINNIVPDLAPHNWISIDEAIRWWEDIYTGSESDELVEISKTKEEKKSKLFDEYKKEKNKDFLDEDIKAMLIFLTRKSRPNGSATLSWFRKLRDLIQFHTNKSESSFENDILINLRTGKIVIIDLSQWDPLIQSTYSDKICRKIFENSMQRFTHNKPNNFLQFYFEEAHNLFPKKDDKDLTQIYNRIAKEWAKLNLGMIYATQEVSSISSNILKNTQNWFIAHLNNDDELKELKKYYDFSDFTDSLIRFSANTDKWFVRMKTYTNPFVVPIQIDRFLAN